MTSKEMQKALEADGEKLRQLTGEDHGPYTVEAGTVTAANQSPELIALAKYLAHLAGWETEPIPKKYQSEASAIRAALHAAGYKIMAREPTQAMLKMWMGEAHKSIYRIMWDQSQ